MVWIPSATYKMVSDDVVTDGYEGTLPVGAFPRNGYRLHDMIGNVREWTTDWYVPKHSAETMKPCCVPRNPRGHVEFRCIVRSGTAAIESHRT